MRPRLVTLIGWSTAAALAGCSIDNRELQLGMGASAGEADSPQGGEPGSSSGGSGSGSGSDSAGAAGTSDLIEGCADLDTDLVADCHVTLLDNATFTDAVSSWVAVGDATLVWDPKNALTDSPSGSAKLSSSALRASASQCVPLVGEQLVIAYGQAFVVPGSQVEQPHALLEVSFFSRENCGGERDRFFETPPSLVSGEWVTIQAGNLSKPTTQSVSIALVGSGMSGAGQRSFYFDNILLKMQPLEL